MQQVGLKVKMAIMAWGPDLLIKVGLKVEFV